MIVSVYPFASVDSFLLQISLEDNLKLKETLESERFHKHFNFFQPENANEKTSDGGWNPKL